MQRVCKDAGTPLKRREKHWEATLVCSQVEKGKAGPKGCSDKCVGLGHAALICRVCGEAVLICKRKQGRNAEGGEARQMQRSSVAAPCWRRPMASHQGSSRARLRARCCSSCSSSAPQTCVNVNGAIRIWWEQFHGISRPIAIATRRYTKQTNPLPGSGRRLVGLRATEPLAVQRRLHMVPQLRCTTACTTARERTTACTRESGGPLGHAAPPPPPLCLARPRMHSHSRAVHLLVEQRRLDVLPLQPDPLAAFAPLLLPHVLRLQQRPVRGKEVQAASSADHPYRTRLLPSHSQPCPPPRYCC